MSHFSIPNTTSDGPTISTTEVESGGNSFESGGIHWGGAYISSFGGGTGETIFVFVDCMALEVRLIRPKRRELKGSVRSTSIDLTGSKKGRRGTSE
jgi:hypothetical protein